MNLGYSLQCKVYSLQFVQYILRTPYIVGITFCTIYWLFLFWGLTLTPSNTHKKTEQHHNAKDIDVMEDVYDTTCCLILSGSCQLIFHFKVCVVGTKREL